VVPLRLKTRYELWLLAFHDKDGSGEQRVFDWYWQHIKCTRM